MTVPETGYPAVKRGWSCCPRSNHSTENVVSSFLDGYASVASPANGVFLFAIGKTIQVYVKATFDISLHFIILRFPYNEEVVKILDEQTVGGVVGVVNKVLLFITVYMNVVSVYLGEGEWEGFARYSMSGGEGCLSIDGFTFGCMLRWHSADCWLEC